MVTNIHLIGLSCYKVDYFLNLVRKGEICRKGVECILVSLVETVLEIEFITNG